jgi:hypothetical protein
MTDANWSHGKNELADCSPVLGLEQTVAWQEFRQ